MTTRLSHIDDQGKAKMVDVGEKQTTSRTATASAVVKLSADAFDAVVRGDVKKGDVLSTARIAGIMSAKRVSTLIPLCHQIPLDVVSVDFFPDEKKHEIRLESTASARWTTGVEMEALSSVSVAALTIYDMCKAIDKSISISDISLKYKSGGKSGIYEREE